MSSYEYEGRKLPSVTTIIGDCSPKEWGPPWGANMAVEWIRQNCDYSVMKPLNHDKIYLDRTGYFVSYNDLDNARKNFRDVQQTALDVGSEVHKAIETFTSILIKTGNSLDDYNTYNFIVEDLSPQAANSFGAFLEWADENEFVPIES